METSVENDQDALRFSIEKSLRYHQRRRAFFESVHRSLMFAVILLGSAGASAIFGASAWLAFAAALAGAIDLVWSPGSRARDHIVLHQKFSALMMEITRAAAPDAAAVADLRARRIEIEMGEPPIYWALEKDCHNEVCYAFGREKSANLYTLTPAERLLMNFLRFDRVG